MSWLTGDTFSFYATSLLAKGTFVLAVCYVLNLILQRVSAAVRRAVCTASTVSLISLPLIMLAVPAWRVPLLPGESAVHSASEPGSSAGQTYDRSAGGAAPGVGAATRDAVAGVDAVPKNAAVSMSPAGIVGIVWLAGTMALLAWLLIGRAVLHRIRRRAVRATSDWQHSLALEQASMGVRSRVQVVLSADVSAPLTWGIRRPVIVLPAEACEWDDERRRIVLRHELAHVVRRDSFTQLLAGVACAMYWFHPGAWWLSRMLRVERERACDDVVLTGGVSGAMYAGHLLDVARASRAMNLSGMVSIAMARPSNFEGRLLAVLDDTRARRHRLPRYAVVPACIGVLALAAFQPVPRTAVATNKITPPASDLQSNDVPIDNRTSPLQASAHEPEAQSANAGTPADTSVSVRVAPGGTLYVTLRTGGSIEVKGRDDGLVKVDAKLEGTETNVRIEKVTDGVQLQSSAANALGESRTNHVFRVTVPSHYNVRIESAGGSVVVEDLEGSISGTIAGGRIRIERARGRVSLNTGGGDITVLSSDVTGSVSTGSGEVLIKDVTGGLRGSTGRGDVTYSNASVSLVDTTPRLTTFSADDVGIGGGTRKGTGNGRIPYTVDKAGGAIRLDRLPVGGRLMTGGGDITVGESGGLVFARTGGGDIRLGSVRGGAEAHTGSGDVEITIPSTGGEAVDISITTGHGTVILNLPADASAVLDLDATYTQSASEPAAVRSDFKLATSALPDWDSSMGSPRRHVRATGMIGGGAGRIRVRSVNGDIIVRRR